MLKLTKKNNLKYNNNKTKYCIDMVRYLFCISLSAYANFKFDRILKKDEKLKTGCFSFFFLF